MPRGARIAGWVYFPIHVAVLPLTIGVLLMAVLGELPSDVTCNVWYYLIGLVFTIAVMWRFLHRSYDTMAGSILRCIGMMLAAYGIDVLLSRAVEGLTRSAAQRLCESGLVTRGCSRSCCSSARGSSASCPCRTTTP